MSFVSGTLQAYGAAGRSAVSSLAGSWLAALVLGVGSALLGVLAVVVAPMGIAGGFLLGLTHAALAGTYLFLLEIAVLHRRQVTAADVSASLGRYVWDVISVLFIFWIASMLLGALGVPMLQLAMILLAFILLNPVPELVYQGHTRSVALLRDAGRFIFDNWIEWFLPHVVIIGLLFLAVPGRGLEHLQLFGPFFGFLGVARGFFVEVFTGTFSGRGVAETVFLLVVVHLAMLFRGHLFRELSLGSSRARAWRARLE